MQPDRQRMDLIAERDKRGGRLREPAAPDLPNMAASPVTTTAELELAEHPVRHAVAF